MNVSFKPLLHVLTIAGLSLLVNQWSFAQESTPSPPEQKEFILDTKTASFAGIKFKLGGADAIKMLPFDDPNHREAALRKFANFMEPPRKNSHMEVYVPGASGVTMRLNSYNGQFAQLDVKSDAVKTTEGVGVGSRFEEFVAKYGEPQIRESPNNPTLYAFSTSNPALSIVLRSNQSPVRYFMAAYDLRK
jgi:hypothetical protein